MHEGRERKNSGQKISHDAHAGNDLRLACLWSKRIVVCVCVCVCVCVRVCVPTSSHCIELICGAVGTRNISMKCDIKCAI